MGYIPAGARPGPAHCAVPIPHPMAPFMPMANFIYEPPRPLMQSPLTRMRMPAASPCQYHTAMPSVLSDAASLDFALNGRQRGIDIRTTPQMQTDEQHTIGFGIVSIGVPSVVLPVYLQQRTTVPLAVRAGLASATLIPPQLRSVRFVPDRGNVAVLDSLPLEIRSDTAAVLRLEYFPDGEEGPMLPVTCLFEFESARFGTPLSWISESQLVARTLKATKTLTDGFIFGLRRAP